MKQEWKLRDVHEESVKRLQEELLLPEPIARLLVGRGIMQPEDASRFMDKSLQNLCHPMMLNGMNEASKRLADAVSKGERILVHGDFDADGITSTALLTLFLRSVGAHVTAFVPSRLQEGHGISDRSLMICQRDGIKLLVTCDCGSSDFSQIEKLKGLGVDTIVTDHHEAKDGFPTHAILVNPKARGNEGSEHDDLAGVGVAFMTAAALRSELRERGFFERRPEPNLKEFLDIVALGTIADLAKLVGQNRILVDSGLRALEVTQRPGLIKLKEVSGIHFKVPLEEEDVGFRLAPRINAAARMGQSDTALRLLITDDPKEAQELAKTLDQLNQERKNMESQMFRIAYRQALIQAEERHPVIIVRDPKFHPGVIGLVAQKLAKTFFRPAFVFTEADGVLKGSARSSGAAHLVEAMQPLAEILIEFGGHREAGGCSLDPKNFESFIRGIRENISMQGDIASREILIDAELNLRHLNRGFLDTLGQLRPFGMGNPEPVFASRVRVVGTAKEVGENHVQVRLRGDTGEVFSAVGFGLWKAVGSHLRGDVKIAFTPVEQEWRSVKEIRLRLKDVQAMNEPR